MVTGLDISRHRVVEHWETLASKARFLLMKATDGTSWVDPTFENNWFTCPLWGIVRGAFHYYQPRLDAERQAEHYHRVISSAGVHGMLPPMVDFEEDDAQPAQLRVTLKSSVQTQGKSP